MQPAVCDMRYSEMSVFEISRVDYNFKVSALILMTKCSLLYLRLRKKQKMLLKDYQINLCKSLVDQVPESNSVAGPHMNIFKLIYYYQIYVMRREREREREREN